MEKDEVLNTITGLLNLNCIEDNTETWRFAEQLIETLEENWYDNNQTNGVVFKPLRKYL